MTQTWSFVAMEYYALILNRTYLVCVGDGEITGSVCRGLTGVEGGGDILTRKIAERLAVHGDLLDPASYIDDDVLSKDHRANFGIKLSEVQSVTYDPSKKWGMGYYPHDGRVTVVTPARKRELIILGEQSGREIAAASTRLQGRPNIAFKPKLHRYANNMANKACHVVSYALQFGLT